LKNGQYRGCRGETAFYERFSVTPFRDGRRESVNFNFLADPNLVTTDVKLVSSNESTVVFSQGTERKLVGEIYRENALGFGKGRYLSLR
jgi:hypothetical protein